MKKILVLLTVFGAVSWSAQSQVLLNELLFNPVGTDGPNEFFELRGTASLSLSGYYLIGIEGDSASGPGDVQDIFDLGAYSLGANGFLVAFQKANTYGPAAGAATSIVNAGTGAGWGSGASSSVGHSADSGATDVENASATYMLINIGAGAAPTLTQDLDSDNDGAIDALPTGWTILDSVGVTDASTDISYGAITFRATPSLGIASGTVVDLAYGTGSYYLGRKGNSTGTTADDWVESIVAGTAPGFTFDATQVTDGWYAGQGLSIMQLGAANAVPEPTTGVLIAGAGLVFWLASRRRRA